MYWLGEKGSKAQDMKEKIATSYDEPCAILWKDGPTERRLT